MFGAKTDTAADRWQDANFQQPARLSRGEGEQQSSTIDPDRTSVISGVLVDHDDAKSMNKESSFLQLRRSFQMGDMNKKVELWARYEKHGTLNISLDATSNKSMFCLSVVGR